MVGGGTFFCVGAAVTHVDPSDSQVCSVVVAFRALRRRYGPCLQAIASSQMAASPTQASHMADEDSYSCEVSVDPAWTAVVHVDHFQYQVSGHIFYGRHAFYD